MVWSIESHQKLMSMCHIPSNNVFDLYELSRETQVCFNVFNLRNVLVHSIKTYYIHLALVSYLSKLTRKVYITNIILRSLMKIVLYGINIDPQLNNLPLKTNFLKFCYILFSIMYWLQMLNLMQLFLSLILCRFATHCP